MLRRWTSDGGPWFSGSVGKELVDGASPTPTGSFGQDANSSFPKN
jgi:hypothetical protein